MIKMKNCLLMQGDWKACQYAFSKGISVRAFAQLKALKNLVADRNIRKYDAFGLEIHILTDISEDLGFEGIPTHIGHKNYLDTKINQLKGNVKNLKDHTAKYIKRVISLMEKVRDSGVPLPEGRRGRMNPIYW